MSRDVDVKALRAGKLPPAMVHHHPTAVGGIPTDSAGAVPSNGMGGLVGGGHMTPGHGHVHTVNNRAPPKNGDPNKRTSQGMQAGSVLLPADQCCLQARTIQQSML